MITSRRRRFCRRRLDQLGQPVPYFGGVWLHKQVAEILGTHARLITFPGCQWRERDPNTLTETEIRALEQSHGWAIERPLLSSRCSGNANQ